jgi:DNA-3-methyladenine glycosylase II
LHLSKDKTLKKVISKVGVIKTKPHTDLYYALMRAIVSQQLSTKAAETIWQRFLLLFNDGYPHPENVLKLRDIELRKVGLSFQKVGYIKNIATFSIEKSLDYKKLKKLSDEDLILHLTSIKGVGRWTVEMILMFSLNRPDVFPLDDLGIQNGIKMMYKLKAEKRDLKKEMLALSEAWRPHRTMACKYIWRFKDGV